MRLYIPRLARRLREREPANVDLAVCRQTPFQNPTLCRDLWTSPVLSHLADQTLAVSADARRLPGKSRTVLDGWDLAGRRVKSQLLAVEPEANSLVLPVPASTDRAGPRPCTEDRELQDHEMHETAAIWNTNAMTTTIFMLPIAALGMSSVRQFAVVRSDEAERLLSLDSVGKLEWRSLGHICRGGQTIPWAAIVDPGSI
jgi:hypothetical protein